MNHTPNTTTVQKYFDCLMSGNFGPLSDLIDDQVVWHQPGHGELSKTYHGKEAVFQLFGRFMEISTGTFKIEQVENLMENGPLVAATLRFSATKPGSSITMRGIDLMRVENGKIKEVYLFSADQAAEDRFWTNAPMSATASCD